MARGNRALDVVISVVIRGQCDNVIRGQRQMFCKPNNAASFFITFITDKNLSNHPPRRYLQFLRGEKHSFVQGGDKFRTVIVCHRQMQCVRRA